MVLQTTEGLIGLVPTIVAAEVVSDLVTGGGRKKKRKQIKKELRNFDLDLSKPKMDFL